MRFRVVRAGGLVLAGCVAAAVVAAETAKAPSATITRRDARKAVAEVFTPVETIRGLTFKKPVPVDAIDDARARERLTARLKKFVSAEKMQADAKAWAMLGLVPPGTDLLASVLDTLEEQAGGFYDPAAKRFFLLDDMPAALAPVLAAHELTHALEDQYFDLDRRLNAVLDDDDKAFATSAVHEGSAMIVMTLYLGASLSSGTMKAEDLKEVSKSEAARAETLRALPQALQRQFIGPYLLGMNFLLRGSPTALGEGFPKADVDRAYKRGPVSSEQILHPEKFWDPAKADAPKPVTLTGTGEALGAGWARRGTGVLGELLLALVTGSRAIDPANALAGQDTSRWTTAAATGWGGDRWELWTRGERSVLVLATVWDSERDAEEFAATLTPREGWSSKRSGTRVGVVIGDAERAGDLLARLAP